MTMSLPLGPRPSISADIAFALGAVARMTVRPAKLLQRLGRVRRLTVDVQTRSELLCERRVLGSAPDGGHVVAELARELNAEVTETADSLHGDEVAGERTTVPQRVEGGNAGAEQRRRFGVAQAVRYGTSASTGASMYSWYPPS